MVLVVDRAGVVAKILTHHGCLIKLPKPYLNLIILAPRSGSELRHTRWPTRTTGGTRIRA